MPRTTPRGLLYAAHCIVDIYSSSLGALQPLLVAQFGLSLSEAGLLGGALILASYLTQPVFGVLADRAPSRLYAVAGPVVAGIGIGALGWAPNLAGLVALVAVAGLGMAMFHPQATSSVGEGSGEHRGRTMGRFIAAGAVGFSIGPTAMAALAGAVTLRGLWMAAAPGVGIAMLLGWRYHPAVRERRREGAARAPLGAGVRRTLTLLFLLVCIRSVVQVTYGHLLPLYFTREMGYSAVGANAVVSAYFAAGAIGGMCGGVLADRWGGRRVIVWSMALSAPLLGMAFAVGGVASIACLVAGGFALLLTIPVNVMMAQALAPERTNTVSALMMGLAWGVTGIVFVPVTAWAAEQWTLRAALAGLTVFPVAGVGLAMRLPAGMGAARAATIPAAVPMRTASLSLVKSLQARLRR